MARPLSRRRWLPRDARVTFANALPVRRSTATPRRVPGHPERPPTRGEGRCDRPARERRRWSPRPEPGTWLTLRAARRGARPPPRQPRRARCVRSRSRPSLRGVATGRPLPARTPAARALPHFGEDEPAARAASSIVVIEGLGEEAAQDALGPRVLRRPLALSATDRCADSRSPRRPTTSPISSLAMTSARHPRLGHALHRPGSCCCRSTAPDFFTAAHPPAKALVRSRLAFGPRRAAFPPESPAAEPRAIVDKLSGCRATAHPLLPTGRFPGSVSLAAWAWLETRPRSRK